MSTPAWARDRALLPAAPFGLFVLLVLGAPLVLLGTYAFRESAFLAAGPGPTLTQFRDLVGDATTVRIAVRSLAIGLLVAAIVTALAFVISYALAFRLRGRVAVLALAAVVMAGIASFVVRVYAWGTILGRDGLVNGALETGRLISKPLEFLLFGYFAIVVVMVYLYLPTAVLLVYGAMQGIDVRTLEASRDLGAGRWRTAFRVVAPQARGGLVAAFALTTVLASANFITPAIVGGVRGLMVGNLILTRALGDADYPAAAALAFSFGMLVVVTLLGFRVLAFATGPLRARSRHAVDRAAQVVQPRVPAALARFSFSRPLALLLILYLIAPTLLVIVFSFNSGSSVGLPWQGFTFDWYGRMVDARGFSDALQGTIRVGLVSVVGAVLLGVPFAFALARTKAARARFVEALVYLPYIVPAILIGTALLTVAVDQGIPLGLDLTTFAHVLITTPVVALIVAARLKGLNPKLVEAARDLGSRPQRAFRTVTLPLIFTSVLGGATLALAFSMDEILVTTFTVGSQSTVPVWLFGQARTRGFSPANNALAVILLLAVVVLAAIAMTLARRSILRPGPPE